MKRLLGGVLWLMCASCGVATPPPPEIIEGDWRSIAEVDSAYALSLLRDHHPGALKVVGDADFQQRLLRAESELAKRLPQVSDYGGYTAVMKGLAATFGDPHIWFAPDAEDSAGAWAGIVIGRQAQQWRVVAQEAWAPSRLVGSALISCDGVQADDWARPRLEGFYADTAVEARVVRASPYLLIDERNPYVPPPAKCEFQHVNGRVEAVNLEWCTDVLSNIRDRIEILSPSPKAGLQIEAIGTGYWIGIETLLDRVEPLVKQVESSKEILREADWILLDLRGNGGGNSAYSSRILAALVGSQRASAGRMKLDCGKAYYRPTRANIDRFKAYRDASSAKGENTRSMDKWIVELELARFARFSLWPMYFRCAKDQSVSTTPVDELPAGAMKGHLLVLTDSRCFSSCLLAVDAALRLGAVHVGQATDRTNRYMEVRVARLPSGHGEFSTLMKLAEGVPDFGPYVPEFAFDGDMSDTASLKQWVQTEVIPRH